MSDKENEPYNNQSVEFQTFSKNCKDSNKTKKKNKDLIEEENYEFTFKKNLFNEKNIKNENILEESGYFYKEPNKKIKQIKSITYNNNYKENKNIFKELFKKNRIVIDKNCNTVILNNVKDRGSKILINNHHKNNKLLKNINNNDKLKSINSNFIHNHTNENKSPLIHTYFSKLKKAYNNSKNKNVHNNKNHSFICQKNKYNINKNNSISSYKLKIIKNVSAKSIHITNENNNKNDFNRTMKNIKTSSQKSITFNNIKEEKKKFEKNNLKISKKNDYQKVKKNIAKKDNKLMLKNNQKNINKIKIDKAPLSCKNLNRTKFKKENKDNNHINNKAYSNLNKVKLNSVNKISSSISIKKTKTFLALNKKNKNCSMGKLNNKPKKKYTPDKNNKKSLTNKINK